MYTTDNTLEQTLIKNSVRKWTTEGEILLLRVAEMCGELEYLSKDLNLPVTFENIALNKGKLLRANTLKYISKNPTTSVPAYLRFSNLIPHSPLS